MSNTIIGRVEEQEELNEALKSAKAELICIYGRRRIGKTFLIREFFKPYLSFEIAGMKKSNSRIQLANFTTLLSKAWGYPIVKPKNWLEAFDLLGQYLDELKSSNKVVIFFDELPWLCSQKSNFLAAFENFWNMDAIRRNNLIVIVGGSAASFMINKIIKNKDGLHNRLSRKIRLKPFTLAETEIFFASRKHRLSRASIMQLYFAFGGVPHYFDLIRRGESPILAIDRLIFKANGLLHDEFDELFGSLFDSRGLHTKAVTVLHKKRSGLRRDEIAKALKVKSGGSLSTMLDELIEAGFISKSLFIDKKNKDHLYILTDNFCLFYLSFESVIANNHDFKTLFKQAYYNSWQGFAFENTCKSHIHFIKRALQIGGVNTYVYSWYGTNDEKKAQIDILLDRDDNTITAIECKYYKEPFAITTRYSQELWSKINVFRSSTGTDKNILFCFISLNGMKQNSLYHELVDNDLDINALF
jgi:uncharacterized protein